MGYRSCRLSNLRARVAAYFTLCPSSALYWIYLWESFIFTDLVSISRAFSISAHRQRPRLRSTILVSSWGHRTSSSLELLWPSLSNSFVTAFTKTTVRCCAEYLFSKDRIRNSSDESWSKISAAKNISYSAWFAGIGQINPCKVNQGILLVRFLMHLLLGITCMSF